MPEIGEVARIVHFIRKHLVGKTLAVVNAQHDDRVFGAVGTSAAEFETKLRGKKVVDAGQQGKYFWLVMSEPPHPLMHFGMAGWFEIRHEITSYKKSAKSEDQSTWPPKYCIFALETAEEPKCEAAFVDFRRFGRVRLVDCPGEDIRQVSPLKENGPDPVIDRELVTEEWFAQSLSKKKLRVKTYLLSQVNISGVGNWVGDEILYQAAIHPETYTNTLTSAQISRLYKSLIEVTSLAVETLADDTKFPESWLFKHRWNKGKKEIASTLPNGEKVSYLTVGGRTTAIVASVQKKTDERKEKRDEISESEKEDGVDGEEEAMDIEEERVVKRTSGSKGGGKKINKKTEALRAESTITVAKHHSEEAHRNTNLPSTGAKQDEEEKSQLDIEETDSSADSKAETPAKKPKRENKLAPDVDQEDEAEPQPNKSEPPPQSTPTPTTKTAKKPKAKPPTGPTEQEEEIGRLVNVPTRKSTRKSRPLIPIPATPTTMAAPPKPKTKEKKTTDRPPPATTHIVHPSSASSSTSSKPPQKRKINPSATGNEEEGREGEGEGLPEPSSNYTAENKVTTTNTSTSTNITNTTTTTTTATTASKKIKTTMKTNLQPPQAEAGSSSHSHSIVLAKNEGEDEDIWEGRRRSRRVSGRGVSPVVGGRKVI